MKIVLEVDLDSPEMHSAYPVFMSIAALLQAMQQKIPPNAKLQSVLNSYPNEGSLVLAESAYDPTHSEDPEYVMSCPINLRITVVDEPFDARCIAKDSAGTADVSISVTAIELGLASASAAKQISDTLPGLKKISQ